MTQKAGFLSAKGGAGIAVPFTDDNRIVRTDTASSPTSIQQSGVTVDDSDNVSGVQNLTVEGDAVIDNSSAEALLVRQNGDSGDLLIVDSRTPTGGSLRRIVRIIPAGGNTIPGSAIVRGLETQMTQGSAATNALGTRAFSNQLICNNGMSATGSEVTGIVSGFSETYWASTGTANEVVGLANFAFGAGGNTINAGKITNLIGGTFQVGWTNSTGTGDTALPITGEITNASGLVIKSPNDRSSGGSHPIDNMRGILIEDLDATDISNVYAIDIQDQSSGFALRTGAGSVQFGDTVETQGGRIRKQTRITSGPYTVLASDHVIFVNTDAGNVTVNLPAGVAGTNYVIKNTGSSGNTVTVNPDGSETIIGATSFVLADGEDIDIDFNSTDYWY